MKNLFRGFVVLFFLNQNQSFSQARYGVSYFEFTSNFSKINPEGMNVRDYAISERNIIRSFESKSKPSELILDYSYLKGYGFDLMVGIKKMKNSQKL